MGKFVLDTESMEGLIESKNIVAMRADLSDENPDASALLNLLGNESNALPFLAVFPGTNVDKAHTLSDYNPFGRDSYRRKLQRVFKQIPKSSSQFASRL